MTQQPLVDEPTRLDQYPVPASLLVEEPPLPGPAQGLYEMAWPSSRQRGARWAR